MNGLSPHSPTPAVSTTAGISAEKTTLSLSRRHPKRIGTACLATYDLRTSTKNLISLTNLSHLGNGVFMMMRTQLYLSESTWKMLHIRARQLRVTISELVREAVSEKHENPKANRD